MNYSLSNILSNGGSLNADGLSLDLAFALDKTLTARKGPTPTFTRASTAKFIGSNGLIQSAAINAARFDHDPITLACKGLLIEESRTNNVTRSQEMNLWGGAGGSTRAVSTENSPDGGTTKGTLASGGSAGFGDIVARSLSSLTSVISTQYTVSCFIKKINYRYVCVDYSPIRLGGVTLPFFDLDTLVFNANGSTVTGSITSYPNGWYRLTVSGAAVRLETSNVDIILCSSVGTAGSSRAGQQIYVWGAQLETGAFASSYIPTTTAALTRSADVCSISSANFAGMANNTKATILWESSVIFGGGNYNSAAFFIGPTNQNGLWCQQAPSSTLGAISNNETTQFDSTLSNTSSGALRKIAMAFDGTGSGNAILCQNGTLGTQDNSVALNSIQGQFYDSGLSLFKQQFSTIKSFRYYTKRLSNAKLQTLTTL